MTHRGYPGYGGERGPRGDEEYLWGGAGGRGPAGGWAMGAPGAGPGGAEYQLWSQGRNDGYATNPMNSWLSTTFLQLPLSLSTC